MRTIHVSMSGNYYVAVFKRRRPLDTGLMTNAMQIMCGRVNEGKYGVYAAIHRILSEEASLGGG